MSCSRGKSTVISECCHSGWQLPFRGLSSPLTLPHIHRWVEDGPNKQSKRGNFRSARHGRMVFTLERIVLPTMVARFQTALSILTWRITYPTTTSIHKVRSPLHNQYLTLSHPDCSRFWECGPAGESCLFECANCCHDGPESGNCNWQCEGKQGYQWALTFDDK